MPLFQLKQSKLHTVKELKFNLEKDLQKITEESLESIFGLQFISTEFALQNLRIDTLAFDPETKSFVIVEYKRDRSFSVVDQGYAYLALMLNNKADFILEYNERTNGRLRKADIDWSQSRVLFLCNSFTTYQREAINFKDLPIELWEVKKYDNGTVLYNQLKAAHAKESIKTISKDKTITTVSREVKTYSIEDHFKEGWDESRGVYEELRDRVMALDDRLEESIKKQYIGFKIGHSILVSVNPRKSKLRLDLTRTNIGDLKDPEKKLEYMKNCLKHYGQHISSVTIENREDIEYAVSLIKRSYERFYG